MLRCFLPPLFEICVCSSPAAASAMEVAGLALGVLGIAGLFTSCIENFDIIVRAKDFGEDFDLMCTQLSLQRIRLALWGETVGLLPSAPERARRVPHNKLIEREDIKPAIVACLCQLRDLLTKADVVTGRYALESTQAYAHEMAAQQTPRGMLVLRDSFQKFKERVRANQKQKSVWEVTRWSVRDCAQFEDLVDKIRKLLDGLESITNALGLLELQRRRLLEEVDSVSDADSLSLLQDVGSSASASAAMKAISETASVRLTVLTGDSQSYYTAKTARTGHTDSLQGVSNLRQKQLMPKLPLRQGVTVGNRPENGIVVDSDKVEELSIHGTSTHDAPTITPLDDSLDTHESIPQHQRWMSALLASRPGVHHMSVFSPNDVHYGEAIDAFKASDDSQYRKMSGKLAVQAHNGLCLAQRVFIELRNIHRAAIPFISAVPVDDALDKILACIEGPPGTPYQGGIFWITVRIAESQPPAMRFHSRIYHPNVDHTGKICADYAGWWQDSKRLNKGPGKGGSLSRDLPWFSEHATNHYSLGALLVALCGLLASPNIQDPLVPEIAEKYVTDYGGYCDAARLYTQKYAAASRPADGDLVFLDGTCVTEEYPRYEAPDFQSKTKTATSSNGAILEANCSPSDMDADPEPRKSRRGLPSILFDLNSPDPISHDPDFVSDSNFNQEHSRNHYIQRVQGYQGQT
ncbi:P-loop containing nucleoside triphosphate hydrolase [Apiospora arundinis]